MTNVNIKKTNCSCFAWVKSWNELSSPLACSLLSELAHTLTTAGCREEQSGRFSWRSLTHPQRYPLKSPLFTLSYTFGKSYLGLWADAWPLRISAQVKSYVLGQKKGGEPLRLVHRKVLRNWQVNCAMHAWAMPPRERSTEDLVIVTCNQHLHCNYQMST